MSTMTARDFDELVEVLSAATGASRVVVWTALLRPRPCASCGIFAPRDEAHISYLYAPHFHGLGLADHCLCCWLLGDDVGPVNGALQ